MKQETAIITYARGGSSLSAIRSLGKKGIRIIAIDSDKYSPGFSSKYTHKAVLHKEKSQNLRAYRNALKKIFEKEHCLTILPMDELSGYILSKYKNEFEEKRNYKMPWPDFAQLKIAQDRKKLLNLAEDLGIPTPKHYTLNEIERGEIEGPWVIKPGYSMIENGHIAVFGKVSYASRINDLKKIFNTMKNQGLNPIIQEFIPGEGYGFFALYNKGTLKASFQHRRLREASITGGGGSLRESTRIPELQKEGLKIPQKLKWHGPLMVEFKKDQRDGSFKLMEINPRFWGSLNLAIQSGVDFPYLFCQMAMTGDCESVLDYKVGIKCKNFDWELLHLNSFFTSSNLSPGILKQNFIKSLFSVILSAFTVKDDYLSKNDLRPFAYELIYTGRALLEKLTKII